MDEKKRFKTLYEVAQELNSDVAPDDVLYTIVRALCGAAGARGCSLMLLTSDGKQLIHDVACGLSDRYIHKGPVNVDAAIAEALSGRPMAILDATCDSRVQYGIQAKREGIVSILSLPLIQRGDVIGIVRIYTSEQRKFSAEETEFFNALANLGAVALGRAKLLEEEKRKFLRFVSIAAHDLKAPLAAVQSFLGVMLGGFTGELNEKQKHMMRRASERITELFGLISDLLDIPRIEKSQLVQEMEDVSLTHIIDSFVEESCSLAEQKGIRFSVEISPDLPSVHGSSPRLQQVITNLVNNAINYTAEGEVAMRVRETDDEILVEITDTGCGIPPEELQKIFDDFFRASNAEIQGTGLGLSISERIVEAHGGRIWAESPCTETGKGSRFSFKLPKKT